MFGYPPWYHSYIKNKMHASQRLVIRCGKCAVQWLEQRYAGAAEDARVAFLLGLHARAGESSHIRDAFHDKIIDPTVLRLILYMADGRYKDVDDSTPVTISNEQD